MSSSRSGATGSAAAPFTPQNTPAAPAGASSSALFTAPGWWLLGVLVLLGGALLWHLDAWGVLETSEARYAEISREMLVSGDWLHPRLLGIGHYHKPPLTYWLTAAGLGLFGGGAGAVRALPVLALLGQAGLVYGLGTLLFAGRRVLAAAAAVVYATLPIVLIAALNVTTDGFLMTWELLAAYGILRYYYRGSTSGLYLFWLGLGLAFLTKGPVGLVLPLMGVAGFYFRQHQARRAFTRHHALGLALFALVGLGWYVYLLAENPAFLRYFLYEHTVQRFGNAATFNRSQPWWFYLVLAPATSLPWVAAVVAGSRQWAALAWPWRNVLVFWVLVPLGFFSLSSSKLLLYVLPIFPGVVLLAVHYLGSVSAVTWARWERISGWYYGVLLLLVAALPVLAAGWPLLGAGELDVVVPATVAMGPGLAGVALVLGQARTKGWERMLLPPVLATVGLLLGGKPLLAANELAFKSARPLAGFLARRDLAGRPVLVYNELAPSLAFSLKQIPVSLFDGNAALRRETQFETSQAWQQTTFDLTARGSRPAVQTLLARPAVLLVHSPVNHQRLWLLAPFSHRATVGSWSVYY